MKTSYIGQRVRVVSTTRFSYIVGKEATVLSVPEQRHGADGRTWTGVLVDVDGIGSVIKEDGFIYRLCPSLDQLEPLTYPDQFTPLEVVCIINPDGTYNPAGDVPLTVVNEEELHA